MFKHRLMFTVHHDTVTTVFRCVTKQNTRFHPPLTLCVLKQVKSNCFNLSKTTLRASVHIWEHAVSLCSDASRKIRSCLDSTSKAIYLQNIHVISVTRESYLTALYSVHLITISLGLQTQIKLRIFFVHLKLAQSKLFSLQFGLNLWSFRLK